jgi:teichuronic acid exporter
MLARHAAPFAMPRLATIRSTLVVSTQLLVERISWYAYSNSDFLIAGRLFGQAALGSYTYAWTLASMPGEKIMSLFWRVTPAVFSAAKEDLSALRRYLMIMTEALSLVLFPATIGLALVAPEFVQLLLGPKWVGAIVPLRFLAIYATMHMISTLLPHVLIVTQQVRYATGIALCALATLPPAFYLFGSLWGTTGVAAAWLVVYPFILIALGRRVLRTLAMSAGEYFGSLWPAFSSSLVMTGIVLLTRAAIPESWPLAIRFAGAVLAGGLAYAGVVMLVHRARVRALFSFLRGARG